MAKKLHPKTGGKKSEERVMVVRREDIFRWGIWNGVRTENLKKYINLISTKHKFLPRGQVETDPAWQQIIPYLVFENSGRIFVTRRKTNHTDLRLANLYSIGVGGHLNKRDVNGRDINVWARREFEEEVWYEGKFKTNFLGLINHDANDVGLVHIGLLIQVIGETDKIEIRDEHKSGELTLLKDVGKYYSRMETWSQIVYDYLSNRMKKRLSKNFQGSTFRLRSRNHLENFSGILPDWLIEQYIAQNKIKISSIDKNWQSSIDQVSIDFHLGGNIKLFKGGAYRFIDTKRGLPDDAMEEINLEEGDPFILEPGAFAIATTRESLKLPNDILGRLEGKSSLARLGILVHSTAARFDPGWDGAPVLELGNLGPKPAILYCGMPICAFTFEKLAAPVKMSYAGSRSDRYSGSKKAVASKIEKHPSALRQAQGSGQVSRQKKHER